MVPIELRIAFRASAFRWRVAENDQVELWRGTELVATMSGAWLLQVLEHATAAAMVQMPLVQALMPRPRLPAVDAPLPAIRKPRQTAPPRNRPQKGAAPMGTA